MTDNLTLTICQNLQCNCENRKCLAIVIIEYAVHPIEHCLRQVVQVTTPPVWWVGDQEHRQPGCPQALDALSRCLALKPIGPAPGAKHHATAPGLPVAIDRGRPRELELPLTPPWHEVRT